MSLILSINPYLRYHFHSFTQPCWLYHVLSSIFQTIWKPYNGNDHRAAD